MDLYSFNINSANELRLRQHLRQVLLPYARTHLTSDHVAFTEKAVEELLLQALEYVPLADATSFLLPTDPLEVLIRSLDSLHLTPPEEIWVTSAGHIKHLRSLFPPLDAQDLRTETCWRDEDYYVNLSWIYSPISSPVLSERARRRTPKFGSTTHRASIPRTVSALTVFLGLNALSVPSREDLPVPPVDDVLDLRLGLDSATRTHARPLLQSVLVPSITEDPVDCFEHTPVVPEFLNCESPPRCPPSLNSPPLFSRALLCPSTLAGGNGSVKNGTSTPAHVPDLFRMLKGTSPELIDGEDGDIDRLHMEVVNGGTMLTFSSPSPPSLHSSDGILEVDGLWDISSSGTPPTSLIAAKMEEVEIPRIRKFGHRNTMTDESAYRTGNAADLLTVRESPGFFITSFISAPIPMAQVHESITFQPEGTKSAVHSPHALSPGKTTFSSLLCQPPSVFEEQAGKETSANPADVIEDLEEQRFDDAVASIYASAPRDPLSYIREEKLDDKDIMLMDVPDLPPPTAHPKEFFFSEGMQTFITPKWELNNLDSVKNGGNDFGPVAFLKPVKGIKPLTLDLSWRPFNFGKTIPTNEDVAGIAKSVQPVGEILGYCDEKYEKTVEVLLDACAPLVPAEEAQRLIPNIARGCSELGTSPAPKRAEECGHFEYLLTRREKLRVSAVNVSLDPEKEVQYVVQATRLQSRSDTHEDTPTWDEDLHGHGHEGSQDPLDMMEYYFPNRGYPFDDSGVDTMNNNVVQFSTSEPAVHLDQHEDDLYFAVDTHEANKENVDNEGENKENEPPLHVGDCRATKSPAEPLPTLYDWSSYFEFPESQTPSFEPLSLTPQSQLLGRSDDLANSVVQNLPSPTPSLPTPSGLRAKGPIDNLVSTSESELEQDFIVNKRRKLDDLVPASSKDLFSTFIALRNQATANCTAETRDDTPTPHQTPDAPKQGLPQVAPDDVFNQNTVRLPERWIPATAVHRYLVSMPLIQKRALVTKLQGDPCRVLLVERQDLGGTDIVVDPDHGVLFVPLLALPANIESTVERISGESWRYSTLLIIFEAFPSAQSHRADRTQVNRPAPHAYTPPICKAVKKLRRNLGIAEGCNTMSAGCTIIWAFANDVEEAAKFVRCFGEEACAISTERGRGVLWDTREWLEEDEQERESDLAAVHGMNAFAAFVILYNRSLESILEMSPEARQAEFGSLLGRQRVMGLNAAIESRLREIAPDIEDSVLGAGY